MTTFLRDITSPQFRRWGYNLAMAVSLALAVLGFIDENWTTALNLVFTALFAIASANTDTTPGRHAAEDDPS